MGFIDLPQEASPLIDTATKARMINRVPSEKQFMAVGHIALDTHSPDEDEKLGLPRSGVVWVHQLYVSFALQRGGFGAAAMGKAEQLATLEPLNASIMALDTVAKKVHMSEALLKLAYDDRGLPRPLVSLPLPATFQDCR